MTVSVMLVPRADGTGGWLRQFDGALDASLKPEALSARRRDDWATQVWWALSGHRTTWGQDYAIRIVDVAHDRTIADEDKRRSEMKVYYRNEVVARLTLLPPSSLKASAGSSKRAPLDPWRHFTECAGAIGAMVEELEKKSNEDLNKNAVAIASSTATMADKLERLNERALRKAYQEEALYAWFARILEAKDRELERIDQQRRQQEELLAKLQRQRDHPESLHLGVNEEVKSEADGVKEEGQAKEKKPATGAAKKRAPAKPRVPKPKVEAAAAAAAPKPAKVKAPPKKRAAAAASAAGKKAPPKRRKKKEASESDEEDEDTPEGSAAEEEEEEEVRPKPKARPTRGVKRRAPPVIEEEDDAAAAETDGESAEAAAAIRRVEEYEASEAAARADGDAEEIFLPLPQRRPGRSAAHRPPTPHASLVASSADLLSPAASSSPAAAASAASPDRSVEARKKRRTASPPPRVLPKRRDSESRRRGTGRLADGGRGRRAAGRRIPVDSPARASWVRSANYPQK